MPPTEHQRVPSHLEQFLVEEVTPHARVRIGAALANKQALQRLSFNRFDLTIDHERGMALLEDVTDASSNGAESVPLAAFISRLG